MYVISSHLNFQDLPLSKMSVADLKKGGKALHKEDYDAALELYNMVYCCTIQLLKFVSLSLLSFTYLYPLKWLTSLSYVSLEREVHISTLNFRGSFMYNPEL